MVDCGALHIIAVVVLGGGARVAEVIVGGVDRAGAGWGRSWSDTALCDLDVADGELGPVAGAGAAVVPEPGGVTAPVRDHEGHVAAHIVAHVVKVLAVSSHAL